MDKMKGEIAAESRIGDFFCSEMPKLLDIALQFGYSIEEKQIYRYILKM